MCKKKLFSEAFTPSKDHFRLARQNAINCIMIFYPLVWKKSFSWIIIQFEKFLAVKSVSFNLNNIVWLDEISECSRFQPTVEKKVFSISYPNIVRVSFICSTSIQNQWRGKLIYIVYNRQYKNIYLLICYVRADTINTVCPSAISIPPHNACII